MNNNWLPKNKTVKFAVAILFLSVSLYVTCLFVITKKIQKIEGLYRDAESEASKEERRWTLKSILASNKEAIQKLREVFVQKGDEVRFIEQIEDVGRKSNIQFTIQSIDIKNKTEDSFKEDVSININISGDWKSLILFLDRLEKLPFGVLVEGLDIKSDEGDKWSGSVKLIIFREK